MMSSSPPQLIAMLLLPWQKPCKWWCGKVDARVAAAAAAAVAAAWRLRPPVS